MRYFLQTAERAQAQDKIAKLTALPIQYPAHVLYDTGYGACVTWYGAAAGAAVAAS